MTGTGENSSGMHYRQLKSRRLMLQRWLNFRYLKPGLRREFGLYPLGS